MSLSVVMMRKDCILVMLVLLESWVLDCGCVLVFGEEKMLV